MIRNRCWRISGRPGWAGLRLGLRGAATLVALISAFALAVAGLGVGPFATFPVPFTPFPMLRRVIGEDIVLTVTGKAATPHVRVDPGQVEQVATGTSRCRTNLAWARPSASYLPRSGAPLQAAVDPSVAKMPDGPEHILLVEDDTLATAPTSEML